MPHQPHHTEAGPAESFFAAARVNFIIHKFNRIITIDAQGAV
jgi:hypothetical protein